MSDFKAGDLIIYQNGSSYEIGKIKRLAEDGSGAWVYYSGGDTASKTPYDHMHKLVNAYTIEATALGRPPIIRNYANAQTELKSARYVLKNLEDMVSIQPPLDGLRSALRYGQAAIDDILTLSGRDDSE